MMVGVLERPRTDERRREPEASGRDLWTLYGASGDPATRASLVSQYLPLVKYVIGRLAICLPTIFDSEDILSYGVMGLLDAIDRFDPTRGVKFESYAVPRVRGSIIDALRSCDPLPRSARDRCRELDGARAALEDQLGRPPTDDEIAGHLGLSAGRYQELSVRGSVTVLSLEDVLGADGDAPTGIRHELFEDQTSPSPTEVAELEELRHSLVEAISQLSERERILLALYYKEELTMREISRALDISESRVCQLHAQALVRLRGYLDPRTT